MYKSLFKSLACIAGLSTLLLSKPLAQDRLNPNEVNGFDRLIMRPYSRSLDYLGTAFEALSLLTPAVMLAAPTEDYWKIGVEYAGSIALAYGAKEIAKRCIDRPRPYMYSRQVAQDGIDSGDWNDSFFSGHATLSFAAASFTACMFCRYFPESKWKVPVIAGSYALAATTAALRLASGNHFMTDVLCGAAVGSAIGCLVPLIGSLWWKPSSSGKCRITSSPLGLSMSIML